MRNRTAITLILFAALGLIIAFGLCVAAVPFLSVEIANNNGPNGQSSLQIAHDIGRLDVISLCLAFLGLGVGFFAIFSFWAIKEEAERIAKEVVKKTVSGEVKAQLELRVRKLKQELLEELRQGTVSAAKSTTLPAVEDAEPIGGGDDDENS